MSESLSYTSELLVETDGLYIDDIGWIAQYHNYYDVRWSSFTMHFMRDLAIEQARTATDPAYLAHCHQRIDSLNSEIQERHDGALG